MTAAANGSGPLLCLFLTMTFLATIYRKPGEIDMGNGVRFIIFVGFLLLCLHSANAKDKGLNKGIKAIHTILLVLIVLGTYQAFHVVFWTIKNPHLILKYYYVPLECFPAWLMLSHFIAALLSGPLELLLAFGLAIRRPRSRTLYVRFIPLFFLVGTMGCMKEMTSVTLESRGHMSVNELWVNAILSLVVMGTLYVVIYRFYVSEKTKRILFGLESSGSDSEQLAPIDSDSQADAATSSEPSIPPDD